jgi:hypothetical protein
MTAAKSGDMSVPVRGGIHALARTQRASVNRVAQIHRLEGQRKFQKTALSGFALLTMAAIRVQRHGLIVQCCQLLPAEMGLWLYLFENKLAVRVRFGPASVKTSPQVEDSTFPTMP